MKTGIELIAKERKRQVSKEGWASAHDDKHRGRQLAKAAECYLATHTDPTIEHRRSPHLMAPCWHWPWVMDWWKPSKDPVRNLVKAGALIAAEIDRLARAARAKEA